jgi:hypothetical protein
MSEFCSPLPRCESLDGRLLLRRAVYGPQLVFDPGPVPLLGVIGQGASLRAYLDLFFSVRWVSKGVCLGPITSIMGLAPGEQVTVGLRTRRTQSFTRLFRDAIESSSVATHTRTRTTERIDLEPDSPGGGGGGFGILDDLFDELAEAADDVIEISPIFAAGFGSVLEDAFGVGGAIVGGALGGPVGAALGGAAGSAIGDLIEGALGGGGGAAAGPALVDTTRRLDEIVDSIERRESQSQLRQTSVTTSTETEQTITRSFSNPYRDRSLELRFIPSYHRFDVVTGIHLARVGLAAVVAEPPRLRPPPGAVLAAMRPLAAAAAVGAPSAVAARPLPGPATPIAAALHLAHADRDEDAVRAPVLELLRRRGAAGEREATVDRGLAWSAAEARGSAVHVPIAEPRTAAKAWGMKGAELTRFVKAVERIDPGKIQLLIPKPIVRTVHVYAGTHVEAVPGECLLPDIPDEHRVIVCCDGGASQG